VADLLVLSQIENNVFRKSITRFDVRIAIAEVMQIQMEKAKFSNIEFTAEFSGFVNDDFLICTDKMRLQ
jgi:hypothetical protein